MTFISRSSFSCQVDCQNGAELNTSVVANAFLFLSGTRKKKKEPPRTCSQHKRIKGEKRRRWFPPTIFFPFWASLKSSPPLYEVIPDQQGGRSNDARCQLIKPFHSCGIGMRSSVQLDGNHRFFLTIVT